MARSASTARDTRNVTRATVPAISPFAETVGYSRAVREGRHVYVGGTAPIGSESDDPYEQAKRCLEIIVEALHELGAGPEHVVRTRAYIVDAADWEAVGRAHGEVFGRVLPASAMLVIAGLLDPAWRVEIEADALLPE
jgi:enamine deaminase RidA (YjgF/YER057c/UK114 family)